MSWEMHDKEFESAFRLPVKQRYDYFIKKVADWEKVWSLATKDGWVLACDDEGKEAVPVWPHERFAEACVSQWPGSESRSIELSIWKDRWLPGMLADGRLVAVFPTPGGKGVLVSPDQLTCDLNKEISLME